MKNNKLSDTQKSVIRNMRNGRAMFKNVMSVCFMGGCKMQTFSSLYERRLIKSYGKHKQGRGIEYRLTELGKTIAL